MIIRTLVTLILLMMLPIVGYADNDRTKGLFPTESILNSINNTENVPKNSSNQDMLKTKDKAKQEIITLRENHRIWAITAICLTSVISLLIVIFALHKMNGLASDMVGASGLNFIVFGTIILVTVSDTDQQLTAAIGVLGAIAGYLFGSLKEKTSHAQK